MSAYDLVVVTTTFATREQAVETARRVIEERVVACAQIDGPLESFYDWEGKTCQETEWRLTMKTALECVPTLSSLVHAHHPYQQPQWIVMPVLEASPGYRAWVQASVAKGGH